MRELAIIGAGPAGLTAALFAARNNIDVLIVSKDVGGLANYAHLVENYPGFKGEGQKLMQKIYQQVKSLAVPIKIGEIREVKKENNYFRLIGDEEIKAKAIIFAVGRVPRKLGVPGEENFIGKGVSYCAVCDGPLYKNKIVAVVGGGNSALRAVQLLAKYAKNVYLIHRRDKFRAEQKLIEEVAKLRNVKFILNSTIEEIHGKTKLEKLKIKTNGQTNFIEVDGLFVEIGYEPKVDLFAPLVKTNKAGEIIINNKCETSCEGVFAAGDCTNVPYKQIVIACALGAIAALSATDYLLRKNL